ncbi:hypothetical protein Taro_054571 [Colocasia esculenta]|uniref:Uncharacterized protein n=1 Tax=Colocasia esculenta TaxID=4460 RepID=A0A843XP73_COLES|nr:hypothetical protein [Colocasia esculenta]
MSRAGWGRLTSGMGRRQPSASRSGRDRGLGRIPNRAMFLSRFLPNRAFASSTRPGRFCCGILGRFELLGRCWAGSRREDTMCSGGNAVRDSYLAFFMEVRESKRPHTRHLALSRVEAEGLHHRQCNFLTVVHLGGFGPIAGGGVMSGIREVVERSLERCNDPRTRTSAHAEDPIFAVAAHRSRDPEGL